LKFAWTNGSIPGTEHALSVFYRGSMTLHSRWDTRPKIIMMTARDQKP